jgi:hypothetical protein
LASLPIPVTPGMTIVATTLGDYCPLSPNPGCQQFVEPLGALFSSQGPGSLLPGTNLNRLPGAVMAPGIPGVVDPPTWVWGQTTDIPQDFQLGVASVTGSTLTVPAGALWLVVGVLDSYYADNFDPDHNLAVNITVDPPGNEQILEVHNPEPGTYVMLLTGLAGFVVWRRFQLHRR